VKIIVCIKQVPDTNEVKIDQDKGTLIREGVPSIINPEDKNGIEAAVSLKEEFGGEVIVISMGPSQAKVALKEALAMGADEAILLSDRAFAGSDTWATAYTISQAIKKIGDYDLIFCGRQAIDGDTAQVGPQIAENLGLNQLTYVSKIELEGNKVKARRELEQGYSELETKLPVLVTVLESINKPRYASIKGIVNAHTTQEVQVWTTDDFKVDKDKLGLDASPTQVHETFIPRHEKKGEILEGSYEDIVDNLIKKLRSENVV